MEVFKFSRNRYQTNSSKKIEGIGSLVNNCNAILLTVKKSWLVIGNLYANLSFMGICFFDAYNQRITVQSVFHFYGTMASSQLSIQIAADIASYWNGANGQTVFNGKQLPVYFHIQGVFCPDLKPAEVEANVDPVNNYFRVEDYAVYDHSFVDGLNSNTGYFVTTDLQQTGSTAAHEYGHTLGLDHPRNMNIIGEGVPGIMYPRGSWVDAEYQYFIDAKPGGHGGTMNPIHRKVTETDIANLKLEKRLALHKGSFVLGDFTSVWHEKHEKAMHL
jgi:hypothetical protein